MDKEIIKNWGKKVGIVIILIVTIILSSCNNLAKKVVSVVEPFSYVSPFKTYTGKYKIFDLKTFSIELPEDVVITSNTFDGLKYHIKAEGRNFYEISVIPFERDVMEAASDLFYVSRPTIGFYPPSTPFVENNIQGVYSESTENNEILNYEMFCFIKQGFTFLVLSYGRPDKYFSVFDVVKRVKVLSKPLNKEERELILQKLISKYKDEILPFINKEINKEEFGFKILSGFKCTDIKISVIKNYVKIKCTLIGDYANMFPGQKSSLDGILTKVTNLKPYRQYLDLLGYKTIINFYKPSGEQISLEHDLY